MALNATQVRSGISGSLYMAPVGTAMPTDVAAAMAAAWKELGYLSEDGPSLEASTDKEQIRAWQSLDPVRTNLTERSMTTSFTLLQRNLNTLQLAFGGGTVTTTGTAPNEVHTFTPPGDDNTVFERAFVLEVVDGTLKDRFLLYRGQPNLNGAVPFKRDEASGFEIEINHLRSADGTWKLESNDAAVASAA